MELLERLQGSVFKNIESVIMPISGKIAANPYVASVRDGFISAMPFLLIGSFLLLLGSPPFPQETSNFFGSLWWSLIDLIGRENIILPFRMSMGIFALWVAFGISYNLAKLKNKHSISPMNAGLLSLMTFMLLASPAKDGVMSTAFLGGTGVFTAMLCGLYVPILMNFLRDKNIRIHMPEQVPTKIRDSFDLLLPILAVFLTVHPLNIALYEAFDLTIPTAVMEAFKPLISASDSLFAMLIIVIVIQLLWFSGIHGSGVAESVYTPLLLANLAANQAAFESGQAIPHILTTPLLMSFVFIGGAGGTLGLVFLMRRSKAAHLKSIGTLSTIPSLFNINEPVIFGTPIVMNPSFFIPWMVAPIVNTFIVWGAFSSGFVHKVIALAPWTIPAPIAASMSTGWSITAPLVVVITFIVSFLLYVPFFKMYEKQLLAQEGNK